MTIPDPSLSVGLNAVIVALTHEQPRVLTVSVPQEAPIDGGLDALPAGPLDPGGDRTLALALRRWVRAETGLELGYLEQLYTFGDRFRDPRERGGGPRVVTVAYLALVGEVEVPSGLAAQWRSIYRFFPGEDFRGGRPAVLDECIIPAVEEWIGAATDRADREDRQERAGIAFALDGGVWDGERVLERYELLYEINLVGEATGDGDRLSGRAAQRTASSSSGVPDTGQAMAFDHRRILATALGRIRAKIKYRPVIFELMPDSFTLSQLQQAVEALAGVGLHKQNFRRLVEQGGLVEPTGEVLANTGGRPAALFRFRREVVVERPAPGVGLPGARRG